MESIIQKVESNLKIIILVSIILAAAIGVTAVLTSKSSILSDGNTLSGRYTCNTEAGSTVHLDFRRDGTVVYTAPYGTESFFTYRRGNTTVEILDKGGYIEGTGYFSADKREIRFSHTTFAGGIPNKENILIFIKK
jgi:hypothetical protein